jgi:hypothetical protein
VEIWLNIADFEAKTGIWGKALYSIAEDNYPALKSRFFLPLEVFPRRFPVAVSTGFGARLAFSHPFFLRAPLRFSPGAGSGGEPYLPN